MTFIIKHSQDIKPKKRNVVKNNTKETEKEKVMDKISMAEQIINDTPAPVKRIKKDKGLIERTESSKIVITEDNKQLLND
jgi:hypothetical protein